MQLDWDRTDVAVENRSLASLRDKHHTYTTAALCIRYAGRSAVSSLLRVPYTVVNGIFSSDLAADYLVAADDAATLNGTEPVEFALNTHEHQYALREGETTASEFVNGVTTDALASVLHYHREYRKRGTTHGYSAALGGKSPEEYSPTSHTHDNYVPRSESFVAGAAYTIDGVSASELAALSHAHGEYMQIDEPVADAESFFTAHGLILSVMGVAAAEHTHDDIFYTRAQTSAMFIADGVLGNADTLVAEKIATNAVTAISAYGRGSGDYSQLLFPYNSGGMASTAYVSMNFTEASPSEETVHPVFYDLWLLPGSYVTLELDTGEVAGALPSVYVQSATGEVAGKSEYVTVYYKGAEIYIRAVEYADAFVSMKVRLTVLVKEVEVA